MLRAARIREAKRGVRQPKPKLSVEDAAKVLDALHKQIFRLNQEVGFLKLTVQRLHDAKS